MKEVNRYVRPLIYCLEVCPEGVICYSISTDHKIVEDPVEKEIIEW